MARADAHQAALQSLFASDVVTVSGDPREGSEPMTPAEAALVARAVDKRRAEFAKGRECARRALARFGIHEFSLLSGKQRQPLWPDGIVGTVTHCEGFCGVAVASRGRYASLGIDAEPDEPLEARLGKRICTPRELERLDQLAEPERGRMMRLVFSAKEAFYKCQHTLSEEFIGFHEAEVAFANDEFTVTLLRPAGPFVAHAKFHGAWRRGEGLLVTGVALRR